MSKRTPEQPRRRRDDDKPSVRELLVQVAKLQQRIEILQNKNAQLVQALWAAQHPTRPGEPEPEQPPAPEPEPEQPPAPPQPVTPVVGGIWWYLDQLETINPNQLDTYIDLTAPNFSGIALMDFEGDDLNNIPFMLECIARVRERRPSALIGIYPLVREVYATSTRALHVKMTPFIPVYEAADIVFSPAYRLLDGNSETQQQYLQLHYRATRLLMPHKQTVPLYWHRKHSSTPTAYQLITPEEMQFDMVALREAMSDVPAADIAIAFWALNNRDEDHWVDGSNPQAHVAALAEIPAGVSWEDWRDAGRARTLALTRRHFLGEGVAIPDMPSAPAPQPEAPGPTLPPREPSGTIRLNNGDTLIENKAITANPVWRMPDELQPDGTIRRGNLAGGEAISAEGRAPRDVIIRNSSVESVRYGMIAGGRLLVLEDTEWNATGETDPYCLRGGWDFITVKRSTFNNLGDNNYGEKALLRFYGCADASFEDCTFTGGRVNFGSGPDNEHQGTEPFNGSCNRCRFNCERLQVNDAGSDVQCVSCDFAGCQHISGNVTLRGCVNVPDSRAGNVQVLP